MSAKSAYRSAYAFLQYLDRQLDLFPHWLTALWERALPVMQILFWCRFSVGVVLIAAGFLFLAPQGREIAIRVGDDLLPTLFVVIGTFAWAFHSWMGGRMVLRKRYGPDRGAERGDAFQAAGRRRTTPYWPGRDPDRDPCRTAGVG